MSDSIPDKPSQAEGDVGDDDITQAGSADDIDDNAVGDTPADDRP